MNPELHGFLLLIHLPKCMTDNFDPRTDFSLADLPATEQQVDECFRTLPWCRRVQANHQTITRQEWVKRKAESNGRRVYHVT